MFFLCLSLFFLLTIYYCNYSSTTRTTTGTRTITLPPLFNNTHERGSRRVKTRLEPPSFLLPFKHEVEGLETCQNTSQASPFPLPSLHEVEGLGTCQNTSQVPEYQTRGLETRFDASRASLIYWPGYHHHVDERERERGRG